MTSEITVTVGDLYENLHVQFSENLDDEYEQTLRRNIEDFLHNYNQQLDRRVEQQSDVQTADEHVHKSE